MGREFKVGWLPKWDQRMKQRKTAWVLDVLCSQDRREFECSGLQKGARRAGGEATPPPRPFCCVIKTIVHIKHRKHVVFLTLHVAQRGENSKAVACRKANREKQFGFLTFFAEKKVVVHPTVLIHLL